MTIEDKLEKVAEEAEDLVELAEDLGLISEADEAKYKAILKKAYQHCWLRFPCLLFSLTE